MNVVVTGAAGFLGRHLCRALLEQWPEAHVVGVGRGDPANLPAQHERFRFARSGLGGLPDGPAVSALIDADVVFHLAAETGTRLAANRGFALANGNCALTQNVLHVTQQARFIFVSTAEVYGDSPAPRAEIDPIVLRANSTSCYALGKAFDEAVVRARGGVVCRLFNPVGAGQQPEAAVPAFVRAALRHRKIVLDGDGEQVRAFAHVDDVVRGMIAVAEKGEPGEVYNVGVDRPISVRDLAFLVARNAIGDEGCEVVTRFASRDVVGVRCRRPDVAKLAALGWAPTRTLEEAILDIAAEVRNG